MSWDFQSDRSIYLQIIEQIKLNIFSGKSKPGDKVGSVRELAKEAAVNPNTMQKSLSELEKLGFIYKERTKERFITKDLNLINKAKENYAKLIIADFFKQMKNIGYDKEQIQKLIAVKCKEDL